MMSLGGLKAEESHPAHSLRIRSIYTRWESRIQLHLFFSTILPSFILLTSNFTVTNTTFDTVYIFFLISMHNMVHQREQGRLTLEDRLDLIDYSSNATR